MENAKKLMLSVALALALFACDEADQRKVRSPQCRLAVQRFVEADSLYNAAIKMEPLTTDPDAGAYPQYIGELWSTRQYLYNRMMKKECH